MLHLGQLVSPWWPVINNKNPRWVHTHQSSPNICLRTLSRPQFIYLSGLLGWDSFLAFLAFDDLVLRGPAQTFHKMCPYWNLSEAFLTVRLRFRVWGRMTGPSSIFIITHQGCTRWHIFISFDAPSCFISNHCKWDFFFWITEYF